MLLKLVTVKKIFSVGLLSSSYHPKTTEQDWVKFKGLGAAFNLKVVEE